LSSLKHSTNQQKRKEKAQPKKEGRGKEMVFDKKEWKKEYNKKYYQENKEKIKEYDKKYYQENQEKIKEYREKTKEWKKEYNKKYRQENKELVYNHYGNGVIECACCGEKEIDFLSLDHIYNNGAKHRKKIGKTISFKWIMKNNFPPIFQLLCMNCNFSKGKRKNNCKCIHQIRREEKEKRKQEEEKE